MMSFKMALRSISANKLRAVLTMLGIIIGVMALVVLVSLVNGATDRVQGAVSELGSNYISASIWDDGGYTLTLDDLNAWAEEEPAVDYVAPNSSDSCTGKFGTTSQSVTVYGTTPGYYDIQGLQLETGRFIKNTDLDNASRVCVLSESAAEKLVGYSECVGEEISLDGAHYTIVGVLGESSSLMQMMGDLAVYIPYTSMMRLFSDYSDSITDFLVAAPAGVEMSETESVVNDYLYNLFGDDDGFYVYSMDSMESAMDSVTSVLSVLLGGIASISLIVGGIGIMNIMLVTVTERTREIGIRKAIGASRRSILNQFLLEAVVLCMMGCAIGIFLSWGILRIASGIVSDLSMSFNLGGGVVLISVVFCFLIGLIFGLYPANKAAKMKPIDALHYGG